MLRRSALEALLLNTSCEPFSGCWLWIGTLNYKGYGVLAAEGKYQLAHRAAYEMFIGPIPCGLQIDHLCRVRSCVNPQHMEPVTLQENVRRGEVGITYRNRTHCPRGHAYDDLNTIRSRGERKCRECSNLSRREARAKRGAVPRPQKIQLVCNGESHHLTEWGRITGIDRHTIQHRLANGWSINRALGRAE